MLSRFGGPLCESSESDRNSLNLRYADNRAPDRVMIGALLGPIPSRHRVDGCRRCCARLARKCQHKVQRVRIRFSCFYNEAKRESQLAHGVVLSQNVRDQPLRAAL